MSNTVRLSKSTYCEAIQCLKILWLDKNKPQVAVEIDNDAILETGVEVGNVAKDLFGEYKNIDSDMGLARMIIATIEAIEDGCKVITEASFSYKNNFCSIDILKNNNGELDIFEVKSATEIKEIYIHDLSYQYYVLSRLGYKIKSANIVYLNNEYVRNGDLELDKLFIIEDLTETVAGMLDEVKAKIHEINEYMKQKEEAEGDIGPFCTNPYDCKYWQYCTNHLPKNNIFSIASLTKTEKFKFYYSGTYSFEDLQHSNLKPKYLEQVLFELEQRSPKIELAQIEKFLHELYYPIYFLDFETFQQAIPLYDGINPYMQIPFQYSLHYIEKIGGELKHKEFLAESGIDPRWELAKRLVEDIPTHGCVLAYNMGFEKGVIKKLAASYPELASTLLLIHDNIKDLMTPFQQRNYYAKEMAGSYSIKKVLPALFPDDPELDYHELPGVHNGSEAMNAFSNLVNNTEEEQKEIRQGLLEYCKLDTLAMVKIWQKLEDLCKK